MKTKVGIAINQSIVLFKGSGRPSLNFNFIKGTLYKKDYIQQNNIVWPILHTDCIFYSVIYYVEKSYQPNSTYM